MSTRTPRAPWAVTPLMAIGTYLGIYALSALIEPGAWGRSVGLVLLLVAAATALTRTVSRSRFLPTLAGLVTAIVVMVPLFAVDDEGARRILPTPSAVGDLWTAFMDGAAFAASSPAPAEPTRALISLVTAVAIAVFLVADHLAASWGAAATAGVVLLAPWLPAIFLQYRVHLWALLAAIGVWLVAMAAARPASIAQHRSPPLGVAATAAAAVIGVTLLTVPTALGGNGWGDIPRIQTPQRFDASTRLNLALDLRTSLTLNSGSTVLEYTSSGRRPEALKLYTLVDFDGESWSREDTDLGNQPAEYGVLWPEPVDDWGGREHVLLEIAVQGLSERNLPVPTAPRSLRVDGPWFYEPSRDEVSAEEATTQGLTYTVVTDLDYFSKNDLQSSQPAIDAGDDATNGAYTAIPPSVDLGRIRALADELTANANTRYEQAVAIQGYLRSTSNFTYDTAVDPRGGDTVSTFLDDQRGYCVQFATTMVMMARSLDIPARLAVGFLGGRPTSEGTYLVEGGDAHAWPELYFPGEGWVRFEPTPAQQTGALPRYADPSADQVPVNPDDNRPIPTQGPIAPVPTTAPTQAPNPVADDAAATVPWWMIAIVVVLVAGVVAVAVLRRRAVVTRAHRVGPEIAWSQLREHLPEELQWSLALTPHEAVDRLEQDVDALPGGFSPAAHDALARFANAVADHRYAPEGTDASWEELQEWRDTVAHEVRTAWEAQATGRPARAGGRSGPQRDA